MSPGRLLLLAWAVAAASAAADEADSRGALIQQGQAVFTHVCAPCHGKGPGTDGAAMLPGTAALAAKYQGKVPPALENRGDLTAEVLRAFVRHGSGAMPMFRKMEVSDQDIAAIAAYLASSAAESPSSSQ